MSNLLVVDWDYFFPSPEGKPNPTTEEFFLYDWGHSEAWHPALGAALWVNRANVFDMNNLPRPVMNDEWREFWDRFDIDEDAVLYFADSNSQAYHHFVRESVDEAGPSTVWLYDAHHDSGYGKPLEKIKEDQRVSCEDWMCAYHLDGAELHVRYPRWKYWAMDEQDPSIPLDRQIDDGEPVPVKFDVIFLCRSGSWVPPWCDNLFVEFYQAAPVAEFYELAECEPREWDETLVAEHAEVQRKVMNWAVAQTGEPDATP